MKLFTCKQIAEIDQLTMKLEPISPLDLMERASGQIADWIIRHIERERDIYIFAGPGNNGGDALVVARLLAQRNFNCSVWGSRFGKTLSEGSSANLQRLKEETDVQTNVLESEQDIPPIPTNTLIIEGLFQQFVCK